jgi:putative endonuclease
VQKYYVYIMTNKSRTLYTGVTSDLERRVYQHKYKLIKGFTSKYNITRLVWYDEFDDPKQAIEGEKKVKGWIRSKKVALIESMNPRWLDLAEHWYGNGVLQRLSDSDGKDERPTTQTAVGPDPSLRSG